MFLKLEHTWNIVNHGGKLIQARKSAMPDRPPDDNWPLATPYHHGGLEIEPLEKAFVTTDEKREVYKLGVSVGRRIRISLRIFLESWQDWDGS